MTCVKAIKNQSRKNKIDFLAVDHSTSSKKAQSLIGYDPQYDFETGFANTMKWCEDNNLL